MAKHGHQLMHEWRYYIYYLVRIPV